MTAAHRAAPPVFAVLDMDLRIDRQHDLYRWANNGWTAEWDSRLATRQKVNVCDRQGIRCARAGER